MVWSPMRENRNCTLGGRLHTPLPTSNTKAPGIVLALSTSTASPTRTTPPKALFAPSQEGALGLFHLPTRLAAPILAQYQRVLHAEGPSPVHSLFIEALPTRRPRGTETYSIAASYAKAAEAVGCQVKGLASQNRIQHHFPPLRQPNPRGFPPSHVRIHRVNRGIHSHHLSAQPVAPNSPDLLKHGCHKAASLLRAHPNADLGYTDGSHMHKKHSGGVAVLVNSGEEGAMVHSMRVRESSSYPAELWAPYLALTFAKKDTTLIVLSDCSSALQKGAAIESGTCEYYSHTRLHT